MPNRTVNKFTIILAVATFLVLFATVTASAKNGPHLGGAMPGSVNGGFAQETDICAGCHRAHTGVQAKLLKSGTNVFSFCTSCHNGSGANANVLSGIFEGDADIVYDGHNSKTDGVAGMGLNGGGFLQAVGYTDRSNRDPNNNKKDGVPAPNENYGDVASRHAIEGLDGAGPFTAYGGGGSGYGDSGNGLITDPLYGGGRLTLNCISCHDPHGSVNAYDGSERYRILNNKFKRWDSATAAQLVEVGHIVSNEPVDPATGLQIKDYTTDKYQIGIIDFCEACHTQYIYTSSVYNANDGKGFNLRFRHLMGPPLSSGDLTTGNGMPIHTNLTNHVKLPVQQTTYSSYIKDTDYLVCLTCHQAHGTKATTSVSSTVGPANSSTLLRLNNRGVCQDCHQR